MLFLNREVLRSSLYVWHLVSKPIERENGESTEVIKLSTIAKRNILGVYSVGSPATPQKTSSCSTSNTKKLGDADRCTSSPAFPAYIRRRPWINFTAQAITEPPCTLSDPSTSEDKNRENARRRRPERADAAAPDDHSSAGRRVGVRPGGAGHPDRRGLQVPHVRLRRGPAPAPAGGAGPPHDAGRPLASAAVAVAAAASAPRVLPSDGARAGARILLLPAGAVRVPVAGWLPDDVWAAGDGDVPARG